jgi:hypothetical protein
MGARLPRSVRWVALIAVCLGANQLWGQQSQALSTDPSINERPASERATVPRLMTLNGMLRTRTGKPLTGVTGLIFSLYRDQQGGAPIWTEVQNALLDDEGRYTVLLGAAQPDGLPMQLFTFNESRWLGVQPQVPGEEEQSRILLVSVPYALKAADADTIGGKPASAFVLANPDGDVGKPSSDKAATDASYSKGNNEPTVSAATLETTEGIALNQNWLYLKGAGDTNHAISNIVGDGEQFRYWNFLDFLRFLNNGDIRSNGDIRLGTDSLGTSRILKTFTTPHAPANAPSQLELGIQDGYATVGMTVKNLREGSFNSQSIDFVTHHGAVSGGTRMTIDRDGNVGIGTASPLAKLDVAGTLKVTNINATTISGNGAGLTNVNAASLAGQPASAFMTRGITYLAGCDTCSTLGDTENQRNIYFNVIGPMTINSITCFADSGSPQIHIQRDTGVGPPSNILSGPLTCNGISGTNFSQNTLNLNDKLDFVMVLASGAKRITVAIKTTVN